jgi:hypothetical protein
MYILQEEKRVLAGGYLQENPKPKLWVLDVSKLCTTEH